MAISYRHEAILPLTLFKETIRMFAYITVYNPIREELC